VGRGRSSCRHYIYITLHASIRARQWGGIGVGTGTSPRGCSRTRRRHSGCDYPFFCRPRKKGRIVPPPSPCLIVFSVAFEWKMRWTVAGKRLRRRRRIAYGCDARLLRRSSVCNSLERVCACVVVVVRPRHACSSSER